VACQRGNQDAEVAVSRRTVADAVAVARSPTNGNDAPASVPGFPREVLRALAASIAPFVRELMP
jgi:hypothetical protein